MFWASHKTMRCHYFLPTSSPCDECFLPYKVPDTLRNAVIPKRKQIFEFNFMLLKLKMVLKDSLFILINIYMDLFLQGLVSLNNSHVIVFIFTFVHFISLNKRHLYILHTYLNISNYFHDKCSSFTTVSFGVISN